MKAEYRIVFNYLIPILKSLATYRLYASICRDARVPIGIKLSLKPLMNLALTQVSIGFAFLLFRAGLLDD
jgi:hypothetical protein